MTEMKRKRRKVQPELLQAAIKLFGLRSFHGVTTRALAAEAGVHDALIYVWFGSKRKLYEKAVDSARDQVMSAFSHIMLDLLGRGNPVSADALGVALRAFHIAMPGDSSRLLVQVVMSDDDPSHLGRRTLDQIENALANILEPRPKLNEKFCPQTTAKLLIRALFWGKAMDCEAEDQQIEEILNQWMLGVVSGVQMN